MTRPMRAVAWGALLAAGGSLLVAGSARGPDGPAGDAAASAHAQHHAHAGTGAGLDAAVHVSPAQQRLVGARIEPAQVTAAQVPVRLYARVVPDETRVFSVNVGIDGFVRELAPVTTNSLVARDQWLATFSAPEARSAIQAYLVALDAAARGAADGDDADQRRVAAAGLAQARDRLVNFGMSDPQLEEVARTRTMPAAIELASPAAGVVMSRTISAGERFARGEELYRVADLTRVWLVADLFGVPAAHVRPGMPARIVLPGGGSMPAAVSAAALPGFDAGTQSSGVRIEAANPALVLRPGMVVDVELTLDLPPAIVVPAEAVLDAGVRRRVFVERGEGEFEAREVEVGWELGDRVAIVRGLAEGERVVVGATFLFDSESRIRRTPHLHGGTP